MAGEWWRIWLNTGGIRVAVRAWKATATAALRVRVIGEINPEKLCVLLSCTGIVHLRLFFKYGIVVYTKSTYIRLLVALASSRVVNYEASLFEVQIISFRSGSKNQIDRTLLLRPALANMKHHLTSHFIIVIKNGDPPGLVDYSISKIKYIGEHYMHPSDSVTCYW